MDGQPTLSDSGGAQHIGASVPASYDLTRLSRAERLWLWRYRLPSPDGRRLGRCGPRLSRTQAASRLGVPFASYSRSEEGKALGAELEMVERAALPKGGVGSLSMAEMCALARRRSGLRPIEVCDGVGGASRVTLGTWERGGDARLVAFWHVRGFDFGL